MGTSHGRSRPDPNWCTRPFRPFLACAQQFNNTPHDYEITLQRDSVIEICPPDDQDAQGIPDIMFNVRDGRGGPASGILSRYPKGSKHRG